MKFGNYNIGVVPVLLTGTAIAGIMYSSLNTSYVTERVVDEIKKTELSSLVQNTQGVNLVKKEAPTIVTKIQEKIVYVERKPVDAWDKFSEADKKYFLKTGMNDLSKSSKQEVLNHYLQINESKSLYGRVSGAFKNLGLSMDDKQFDERDIVSNLKTLNNYLGGN